MELTDIQIYIALIIGTATSVGFAITGIKFVRRIWGEAVDHHVDKKLGPVLTLCADNKSEIDKLKIRFEDFWKYLRHEKYE